MMIRKKLRGRTDRASDIAGGKKSFVQREIELMNISCPFESEI